MTPLIKALLGPQPFSPETSRSRSWFVKWLVYPLALWWNIRYPLFLHECPLAFLGCCEHYRDYHLLWTNWKFAQGSLLVTAQWLAWPVVPESKPYVYQCGELVDFYQPGDKFDTSKGLEPLDNFKSSDHPIVDLSFGAAPIEGTAYALIRRRQGLSRIKRFLWEHIL